MPFPSSHEAEQVGKFYKRVWLYPKSKTTTPRDSLGSYRPGPRLAPSSGAVPRGTSPQCTRFPAKPLEISGTMGVGVVVSSSRRRLYPHRSDPSPLSGLTGRDPPARDQLVHSRRGMWPAPAGPPASAAWHPGRDLL